MYSNIVFRERKNFKCIPAGFHDGQGKMKMSAAGEIIQTSAR